MPPSVVDVCCECGAQAPVRTGKRHPAHGGRPGGFVCARCAAGGRRANPYRSFGDDRVTLGDYFRTGVQDAQNTCDADDFDFDQGGTADEIVDRLAKDPEFKAAWLDNQMGDFNELDPDACFEAWVSGWYSIARRVVKDELERRAAWRLADEEP